MSLSQAWTISKIFRGLTNVLFAKEPSTASNTKHATFEHIREKSRTLANLQVVQNASAGLMN
jgi:hypothetical protein